MNDHDLDYEFCNHDARKEVSEEANPYDEDGYCCWCGNGSWKLHGPECGWADAHEL